MAKQELTAALQAVVPKTKAARIRQVMPIIEQQMKAGVRRQEILEVLNAQGLQISMETLKTYLYRYRKSLKTGTSQAFETAQDSLFQVPAAESVSHESKFVTYETEPEIPNTPALITPNELSMIMNPGDDMNASELARYESASARKRKGP